jgi:cyclophilin family peptidyl-prolyl cis-trans isomerase
MIQGGRSNSGEDASIWGSPFVDEFDDRLKHIGDGIISSANAGPNTNKRQFFVSHGLLIVKVFGLWS